MSKIGSNSLSSTMALSPNLTVRKPCYNNLQMKLAKQCDLFAVESMDNKPELIELPSNVPDYPESILNSSRNHRSHHVTFSLCDESVEDSQIDILSQQSLNTNLHDYRSKIYCKSLSRKLVNKFRAMKKRTRKQNLNNNTKEIYESNSIKFKFEKRRHACQKKYVNSSLIASLKNSVFLKSSFNAPQTIRKVKNKFPTHLKPDNNLDNLEITSAYANMIDGLNRLNDDCKRKRKSIINWKRPSNSFKRQKVEDWLKLHDDKLEIKSLDKSTIETSDRSSDSQNLINISKMTNTKSSHSPISDKDEDISENLPFYSNRRYDLPNENDAIYQSKITSALCRQKCLELNKNYRIYPSNW